MKCIRCGYCCFHLDVIIIKPEYIDDFNPNDIELEHKVMHKKCGENCPHLKIDNNSLKTTCTVHQKDWYSSTPCYSHYVMGDENKPCRVGEYYLKLKQENN